MHSPFLQMEIQVHQANLHSHSNSKIPFLPLPFLLLVPVFAKPPCLVHGNLQLVRIHLDLDG